MSAPTITVCNATGPYFTEWRFQRLRELANRLHREIGIAAFTLDYAIDEDFHKLRFAYDGHCYFVDCYKILTLSQEGYANKRYFMHRQEEDGICDFFKQGRHKLPWTDV